MFRGTLWHPRYHGRLRPNGRNSLDINARYLV